MADDHQEIERKIQESEQQIRVKDGEIGEIEGKLLDEATRQEEPREIVMKILNQTNERLKEEKKRLEGEKKRLEGEKRRVEEGQEKPCSRGLIMDNQPVGKDDIPTELEVELGDLPGPSSVPSAPSLHEERELVVQSLPSMTQEEKSKAAPLPQDHPGGRLSELVSKREHMEFVDVNESGWWEDVREVFLRGLFMMFCLFMWLVLVKLMLTLFVG